MANSTNMLQLCRLCLVKDDVNIPIFEEQGDIRQIFLKISSCLPVKVSREDRLPKKICDGCSYKLDMLYEFWNTSANAEKQLLSWLGEAGVSSKMADGAISAMAQQMKPTEAFVKEETLEPADLHAAADEDEKEYLFEQQKVEESASAGPSATVTSNEEDEPPPKRARRTAAVKAAIAMDQDSDDDDDSGEPLTKVEDESEDSDGEDHVPAFVDVPSTSADDQPGPSGVGKDGVEAPSAAGFPCSICNSFFKNYKLLITHKKNIHGPRPYRCNLCSKTYRTAKHLNGHKKHFHDKVYMKKCGSCDQTFIDKYRLVKHIEAEHLNLRKPCDQCGLTFKTERFLKNHQSTVHSKREYPCEHCDKIFTNLQYYRSHLKTHTAGYKKEKFTCAICNRSYSFRHGLTRHMREHLGKKETFVCEFCGANFTNGAFFKDHIMTHSDTPFKCPNCDKWFEEKAEMLRHKQVHVIKRPFVCAVCNKDFRLLDDLMIHSRIHDEKRPLWTCSHCGKGLTTKYSLQYHMKVHADERPYKCDFCPRTFRVKSRMELHMCVHTGNTPYHCDQCPKKFAVNSHLKRHKLQSCKNVQLEVAKKIYECENCLKKFATKQSVRRHKCFATDFPDNLLD